MQYQFRPLDHWPGEKSRAKRHSKFRATLSQTLELLERELRQLHARNIVIQADCGESEIRLDGMLRSNAKLRSPAVILSFDSKFGPLSYPCDRFTDWQDNIRAIAMSLEALRSVDRYGVTRRAEQYKGWAKLPPPSRNGHFHSAEDAKRFIETVLGRPVLWNRANCAAAVRFAKAKTHPDAGGSSETFKRVCEAAAMLGVERND